MDNFTTAFTVDQTPEAVFAAITNVRGWWSEEIEGRTDEVGDDVQVSLPGCPSLQDPDTELVPGKKVVWRVLDNYFSFTNDTSEWTGTDIVFDISWQIDETEVKFTHDGLVPDYECYVACS